MYNIILADHYRHPLLRFFSLINSSRVATYCNGIGLKSMVNPSRQSNTRLINSRATIISLILNY